MKKIFSAVRLREIDSATVREEQISSLDLMERAAAAFCEAFCRRWKAPAEVAVFAGPGNNGGDALAIARMLQGSSYHVKVYLFNTTGNLSADCATNKERLIAAVPDMFIEVTQRFEPPQIGRDTIVIDGLFGSGLTRPLTGGFASLVKMLNDSPATRVSIDIPSGLTVDGQFAHDGAPHINAHYTITFQLPKQAMLLADASATMGHVEIVDIGLHRKTIEQTATETFMFAPADLSPLLVPRPAFGHKGTFGHALLIAGRYGMAGAAILAARACLRSGVGKLTIHTPLMNNDVLQTSVPEAILHHDSADMLFTSAFPTAGYDALAIGPGLGTDKASALALFDQMVLTECPMVIDADGLNLLASRTDLYGRIPRGTVLTPHPGEMRRLCRTTDDSDFAVLSAARIMAMERGVYIVLKGHYTAILTPEGKTYFNTTGNSGMATAGSGDVLTGIILAFLAQHYNPLTATILGVGLHGLAGDLAARQLGEDSMTASDIIACLPEAFKKIRNNHQS